MAKKKKPIVVTIEISGPMGSGKTTLLKEIGAALASNGRSVAYSTTQVRMKNDDRVVLLIERDGG